MNLFELMGLTTITKIFCDKEKDRTTTLSIEVHDNDWYNNSDRYNEEEEKTKNALRELDATLKFVNDYLKRTNNTEKKQ